MQEHTDPQLEESNGILNIKFNEANTDLLLEAHQEVWSPTPFALQMGELVSRDDCTQKNIIDFASGSGIFSVIAGQNGAAKVVATDANPAAIVMTERNWALNKLDPARLHAIESDCFNAILGNADFEEQFDIMYSNPPTVPGEKSDTQKASADDWNINGEGGRVVLDALVTQGRRFLKPHGEILFASTSKQGTRLTCGLLDQHWGKGIQSDGDDPLDYQINWKERGDANWAVVRRFDLLLSDYYLPFLPEIRKFAKDQEQPDPIIEKDGHLYQKIYFIRAKK
jgi:methylase of polypeptide subunit release factors